MPLLFDMVSILQTRKLRLRDIREVEYGLWIQGRALFHSTCQSALYKTVSPLPSAWFPTSSINCIGYFLSFTPTSLSSSSLILTWIQNSDKLGKTLPAHLCCDVPSQENLSPPSQLLQSSPSWPKLLRRLKIDYILFIWKLSSIVLHTFAFILLPPNTNLYCLYGFIAQHLPRHRGWQL